MASKTNLENNVRNTELKKKLSVKQTKKREQKKLNKKLKKKIKKIKNPKGFTLIKNVIPSNKSEIQRVLPHWLCNPIQVEATSEDKSITELCPYLHSKLVKRLKREKISSLFPVQQTVIPLILSAANGFEARFRPRDICVATPTGSGKTLAFVLPIVQSLAAKKTYPMIRALAILPVIDLAQQVFQVFDTYASVFDLKVGRMVSEENFRREQSELVQKTYDGYITKVDILVSTPGRLIHHIMNTPGLDFSQLRFLVLDEADKMLSADGGELIARIQNHLTHLKREPALYFTLPPVLWPRERVEEDPSFGLGYRGMSDSVSPQFMQRTNVEDAQLPKVEGDFCSGSLPVQPVQKLLFSATLSHNPKQLQSASLYRPLLVSSTVFDNSRSQSDTKKTASELMAVMRPSALSEQWVKMEPELKLLAVYYLLRKWVKQNPSFKVLIFTNTIEMTLKVAFVLKELAQGKYSVRHFFAKQNAKARKFIIEKFMKGETNVVVSSDAMARGIDVPGVDCVISFDVPSENTYIHRIGRTARAGKPGRAISFLTDEEFKHFKSMLGKDFENTLEVPIAKEKLEAFGSAFTQALEKLSVESASYGKGGAKMKKTLGRNKKIRTSKTR